MTGSLHPGPSPADPQFLYDNAPCGYLTTRPDGTIVEVNETFLRWTGHGRDDLVGRRRFRDLLTVGARIYYETHFAPLLRMQGEVQEVALDVVCADRRRLPVLLNSVLELDAAGEPQVIRTTVFNATERRRYERELMLARRVAEDSERRVRVLQQVVAELSAAPTGLGVAEALVGAASPAFGADGSAVWLLDAATDRLVVAAVSGRFAGAEPVAVTAQVPPAEALRSREVLVLGSAADVGLRFPTLAGRAPPWGGQCVLLAPLTVAGAGLGVVAFGFAEVRELADNDRRLVRLLGEQAGQALDRARLYDQARQREERSAFLATVTRVMEEVRGLGERAQRLVDRLVPELAGRACVRVGGADGVAAWAGFPAATGAPDPGAPLPAALAELSAAVAQVLADGAARPVAGGDGEPWVVLPLRVRSRVVGTLVLGTPTGPGGADLAFLTDLADRVGLTLENGRLYDQEHRIAQTLQRSLLAGDPPRDPRFSVATHYRAATESLEVGGDWHDAFLITTDKLAVVVGDVVGRGIEAASAMGQLRSAIRALAAAELGPARLVERLDRFVERLDAARLATVAYAEVDLGTGQLTYCCAGHLPPVVQPPDGHPRLLWGGRSAPLGSRAGRTARTEDCVRLAPGSRLLLYTDGLIERRTRTLDVGFSHLTEELQRRRGAPLPGLTAQLADALVSRDQRDDVCLLMLSYGAALRLDRSIAADVNQIAALRRDLRGWLAGNAVPEDCRDALLLACSEAVANAIEHGYRRDAAGLVTVAATVGSDEVELCVRDEGSWLPPVADPVRGRGLFLIRRVMDEVLVESGDTGTVVTMRCRIGGAGVGGAGVGGGRIGGGTAA